MFTVDVKQQNKTKLLYLCVPILSTLQYMCTYPCYFAMCTKGNNFVSLNDQVPFKMAFTLKGTNSFLSELTLIFRREAKLKLADLLNMYKVTLGQKVNKCLYFI